MAPSSRAEQPENPHPSPRETGQRAAHFWEDAFQLHGTVTPIILPRVLVFGVFGLVVGALHEVVRWEALKAGWIQFSGIILAAMLVLRLNSGYDRWWEGRRLWGGIVNQSRNLVTLGLSHGPRGRAWREALVRWTAAYAHVCRRSLRGERTLPELVELLGGEVEAARIAQARHMPSLVSLRLSFLLQEGLSGGMDGRAFLAAEQERNRLVDHLGGCERILKTRMPYIYSILLRRLIFLYLVGVAPAVVTEQWWVPGVVTALVAYPMLALDEVAVELENPFSQLNLSHLPLDTLCANLQANLLELLEVERPS
jgi:putative membrane protein